MRKTISIHFVICKFNLLITENRVFYYSEMSTLLNANDLYEDKKDDDYPSYDYYLYMARLRQNI